MDPIPPDQALIQQIVSDRKIRTTVVSESHYWFFNVYFGHYVKYPTAQFQQEMFALTERNDLQNIVVVAFRGSAKSTIMTLSYPIWAILGKQQKKFVIILGQTQAKARQHLINLKREFENNELLRSDLGPFEEQDDEWGSYSLVLPKYGARISAASADQSIRGLRHDAHRPDLIICDDVEDLTSVRTREGRDKIHNWLTGDVIPAGDKDTKLIVIGNLLHEDSLLMRLKDNMDSGQFIGIFKSYPLVTSDDQIMWPGKFASMAEVNSLRTMIGNEIAWQREYLLRIIPDDDQVIYPQWIQYYDKVPPKTHQAYRGTYASVDLAISQKESADYTAVVSALIFGRADRLRIYILPNPIVKKITFPQQVELLKTYNSTILDGSYDKLLVEGVGYQDALPQMLDTLGISAIVVKPTTDKRTRLALTAPLIQSGKIKFPRNGAEEIIRQITGFGVEKHDDVADAFSMLINKTTELHANESTWIMATLGGDTLYYLNYIDIGNEY
jgi:predicted phage terminase large subunit-like protein